MQVIVAAALSVNLLPTFMNDQTHGHLAVVSRNPQDAETYGLKIAQLIIPGVGHRVDALRRFGEYYNRVAPLVTENRVAYLGFIGIAGFLYLVFLLLRNHASDSRLCKLSMLNVTVLLLGTVGGFSSLFSFIVSNTITSYGRICVYIAFFSLLALALVAERAAAKWMTTRLRRAAFGVALAGLVWLGLYDQYPIDVDYNALRQQYVEKDWFVARIESLVPANSTIFQFPYFPFPEHGPVEQLSDYALLAPYLHSKTVHWSYGVIKGRRGDAWDASVAAMPVEEAVDKLAQAGFSGIYVARDGYADHGAKLETSLRSLLGKPKAVTAKGDCAFYSLIDRVAALRAKLGSEEFGRRQLEILTPMYLAWREGFYPPEKYGQSERAWCQAKGRFVIENPSLRPKHVNLDAALQVAQWPATLHLRSDLLNREIHVTQNTYHLSEGFDVPPGEHFIAVETNAHSSKPDDTMLDRRVAFSDAKLETTGQ